MESGWTVPVPAVDGVPFPRLEVEEGNEGE